MKQAYTKPELYAETFVLVEHVALCSGFDTTPGHRNTTFSSVESGCAYMTGDFQLFNVGLEGGSDCDYPGGSDPDDWATWKINCYNNPDGTAGQPFGS